MNDLLDIEVILQRKKYSKIYNFGTIMIIILLMIKLNGSVKKNIL